MLICVDIIVACSYPTVEEIKQHNSEINIEEFPWYKKLDSVSDISTDEILDYALEKYGHELSANGSTPYLFLVEADGIATRL